MTKFLISGETLTKEELQNAVSEAKLEATVEQNHVDCLIVDIHPSDVTGNDKGDNDETMAYINSLETQFFSAFSSLLNDSDDVADDDEDEVPGDDTEDDEE